MSTIQEKNKETVIRFNKAFIEQGDVQAFEELVAPDFVNRSAATLGIPAGRDGIRDYILNVLHKALTEVKVEIYDQIAEGDTVVTRKSISGIQVGAFLDRPATNQRIVMHLIDIVILKDGKYVAHWRYGQVIAEE
jgi:predicted ester cyclase